MSDDMINFEVDGKPAQGKKGQMIMEVTDSIGAYIPRFCYHAKLSIAANCRMCLVEVEKAPKPLPACATPVAEGMKVFTRSPKAIAAQRATMEFLLINHPLDCPICDQGGECELQDLAMGFGRDISRFNDRKRVVKDQDLGPLISTDMTRCIHCTRCVRFGEEVQGFQQLGTIGRGENMKISTYVAQNIEHELSANIIDLCPVGALNNKPYRYSARAWEMVRRATVSPHDCVGSNMHVHVLRGKIKRVVPRENDAINETWLADRDRFSYEGIYADDRLMTPRLKEGGSWRDIGWQEALEILAERWQAAGGNTGILSSPSATVEELHLLSRLADATGTADIDHRLRRRDFQDQDNDPLFPWLGCDIDDIEHQEALLIVGSNLRREAPILAHRVRKAVLKGGRAAFVNREKYDYLFEVADYLSGAPLAGELAAIAVAAASGAALPAAIASLCDGARPDETHRRIATMLTEADGGIVLLGLMAARDDDYSAVRALAAAIANLTGVRFGCLSEGSNSAGAHLTGVLPHRKAGGAAREKAGRDTRGMLDAAHDLMLLFGIEPDRDLTAVADAEAKVAAQGFVAAMTPFVTPAFEKAADLLLPIGTFAESSGTYVNCEGRWQSFGGVATLIGEARPAWKVLRVLGNLLGAEGFEYQSSEEVRDELRGRLGELEPDNRYGRQEPLERSGGEDPAARDVDVPMYEIDPLVRRATALQLTREAERVRVGVSAA